jgi:hypothetical protein
MSQERPALRLVPGALDAPAEWAWFCGHCAAPSRGGEAPPPTARVCPSCGLGLLLETRLDALPTPRDAFVVVDAQLLVQAMSRRAEKLLTVAEDLAVHRPVSNLLVPADSEAGKSAGFAAAVADAVSGGDEPRSAFVRPWNTFGVRMRARIAPCGPPRAALLVLDDRPQRRLKSVQAP